MSSNKKASTFSERSKAASQVRELENWVGKSENKREQEVQGPRPPNIHLFMGEVVQIVTKMRHFFIVWISFQRNFLTENIYSDLSLIPQKVSSNRTRRK